MDQINTLEDKVKKWFKKGETSFVVFLDTSRHMSYDGEG